MPESISLRRTGRALSTSFVVTLAGASACKTTHGGGSGATGPTDPGESKPYISQGDGACQYMVPMHCPPDVSCNPPPPMTADCPPDMRGDAGDPVAPSYARDPEVDDFRPPNRRGWIRIKRQFWSSRAGCFYTADRYCPAPDQKGACDGQVNQKVPCQSGAEAKQAEQPMPEGMKDPWWIQGFVGARSGGRCERYPAFWCDPSYNCTIPKGELVDCATNPPTGKQ